MRYLFIHAHPDDETLSTGTIIACLVAGGHEVLVLTATRGEMGMAIEGSLNEGQDLAQVRETERIRALHALGAVDAGWLGAYPNRNPNHPERRYRDSGMEWVTPTIAGPSPDSTPDSFCQANTDEILDDLEAAIGHHLPDVLVSYDSTGGYGHPDHVRCHEVAKQVARTCGIPCGEIHTTSTPTGTRGSWEESFDAHECGGGVLVGKILDAHRSYPTQFTVDKGKIIHVGGQEQEVILSGRLSFP
ncbi:MAG: PIG-L family deacetylase [Propionibacteriaceae bacterium]|jgi:N-acetyl-1-D-myo-inositol-2-amino-2-deoxy-alpha-D-glucopyranoside deacetylase|nr:PIG-L family deacetylase [Propionibacteriaceae bacterium]